MASNWDAVFATWQKVDGRDKAIESLIAAIERKEREIGELKTRLRQAKACITFLVKENGRG